MHVTPTQDGAVAGQVVVVPHAWKKNAVPTDELSSACVRGSKPTGRCVRNATPHAAGRRAITNIVFNIDFIAPSLILNLPAAFCPLYLDELFQKTHARSAWNCTVPSETGARPPQDYLSASAQLTSIVSRTPSALVDPAVTDTFCMFASSHYSAPPYLDNSSQRKSGHRNNTAPQLYVVASSHNTAGSTATNRHSNRTPIRTILA